MFLKFVEARIAGAGYIVNTDLLPKISGSFNQYKLQSVSPCVASANHASWFLLSFLLIPAAGVTPLVRTRDQMDFCLSLLLHTTCPHIIFKLALSLRHIIRSKDGCWLFLPKWASEKTGLICAWLLLTKPSLVPHTHAGTSLFAVTLRNWFGWKIFFFSPLVLAVTCFPSLV